MKTIELTQGKVAIVDDWNEWLNQFKWCAIRLKGSWYAQRAVRLPNGKWTTQYMHRVIMGNPEGVKIDHKYGDCLLNTEENLRLATNAQNAYNQGLAKHNKSGFKGVSRCRRKWRAGMQVTGKTLHLGCFDTPEAAAQAYNEAALKYQGEFSYQNTLPQEQAARGIKEEKV